MVAGAIIPGMSGRLASKMALKGKFKSIREPLQRLLGLSDEAVKGFQAHHVLPVEYGKLFERKGIDYNDRIYGSFLRRRLGTNPYG